MEHGMTTGGWLMMGVAWSSVFFLLGFCYYRLMRLPSLTEDEPIANGEAAESD